MSQDAEAATWAPTDDAGSLPRLDDDAVRVFEWVAHRGELDAEEAGAELGLPDDRIGAAVSDLLSLHLLRRLPGPRGQVVPVVPEAAAASLVSPLEASLRRQLADIERLRGELTMLSPLYARGQRRQRSSEPLSQVLELDTVIGLIADAAARCQDEVLTCQPGGGRSPSLLEQAFARDYAMLQRGVRMRTLYQHTARHHAPTQEYVRRITDAGAQVRTLSELFGRMIAFDGEVVFVPHREARDGAVVVRDPSTVSYLCSVFDHAWSLAEPYSPARPDDSSLDEIKQAIVRLLSEGMKDEMIARRLGMSLRTCRKHIAEIMEGLGATSRFQAGFLTRARTPAPDA